MEEPIIIDTQLHPDEAYDPLRRTIDEMNKIKTDSQAIQAIKNLSDFCLSQDYCNTCPFYHKERGYNWWENYDCLLTRTDNFTPADWVIG